MTEASPSQATPRVVLAHERIWRLAVPSHPAERAGPGDRRGELVVSAYAVYSDVDGVRNFDACVRPVLRTLAASRARSMLALAMTPATFDAGLLRHALGAARDFGMASLVEVRELWGRTLLELLAAAGPTYVRLAPEFVHGAGQIPDVFRAMVAIGEFARARRLELVARNPRDDHERDALRAAGIVLAQWGSLPFHEDEGALASRPALVR